MKKAIIAACIAALAVTAFVGVSAAAGDSHKAKSSKSKRGPRGPRGPRGFTGVRGPAGTAGVASITRVDSAGVYQGAFGSGQEVKTATATCPAGTYVSGGGFVSSLIDNIVEYQHASATQYSVIAVNEFDQGGMLYAQAICIGGGGIAASNVRSKKTPAAVLKMASDMQAQIDAKQE